MFPTAIRAVRELRPKVFIFENVKGFTRQSFANYFQYIQLQLSYPDIEQRYGETWLEHLSRLEKERTSGSMEGLRYNVVARLLNAADYGIPQMRERVFIVASRSDSDQRWSFPDPTHAYNALLKHQFGARDHWEEHAVKRAHRDQYRSKVSTRSDKVLSAQDGSLRPWRTVRGAISDLPDPRSKSARSIVDHNYQPGAKPYPGQTGSILDLPAKTLKAGDHGVPGGENMIAFPDGTYRYFSVRESARLQTFPDGYIFHGSWTETMRQLGNAVPVRLAQIVGSSVAGQLLSALEEQLRKVTLRRA